jgi:putative ABC transport system permease protein
MNKDYFTLAFRNLRKRKLRSWLTVLGIMISIATIFMLISLSVGLREAINEQFQTLGTDKFFIMPKGQLGAPGTGGAVELTTDDADAISKLPGVKDYTYVIAGNGKVEFNNRIRYFPIYGIPTERMKLFTESTNMDMLSGRVLEKGKRGEVMLGYDFSGNLFGKPVGTNNKITINGIEFRVVGIIDRIGNPSDDRNIIISEEDAQILFSSGKRIDQIIVQIQDGQDIKAVADSAERKLIKERGVTKKTVDFTISTPEELLESFGVILNIITAFLIGVAGISLIVGGVGIMNTMYTSVLERTREIGTMKAVGAKNSDILWVFVIESGLLGLVGGLLGVLVGMGVSKSVEFIAVNQLNTTLLKAIFPAYLILGCLGFAFLAGALAGFWPAWRASKLKAVDALRYE